MTQLCPDNSQTARMIATLPVTVANKIKAAARKNRRSYSNEIALRLINDLKNEATDTAQEPVNTNV